MGTCLQFGSVYGLWLSCHFNEGCNEEELIKMTTEEISGINYIMIKISVAWFFSDRFYLMYIIFYRQCRFMWALFKPIFLTQNLLFHLNIWFAWTDLLFLFLNVLNGFRVQRYNFSLMFSKLCEMDLFAFFCIFFFFAFLVGGQTCNHLLILKENFQPTFQ